MRKCSEAHERTGVLGRPAGREGETLRREKPKRVVDFHLKNRVEEPDARGEQSPEVRAGRTKRCS
jgi:hypothetical protein